MQRRYTGGGSRKGPPSTRNERPDARDRSGYAPDRGRAERGGYGPDRGAERSRYSGERDRYGSGSGSGSDRYRGAVDRDERAYPARGAPGDDRRAYDRRGYGRPADRGERHDPARTAADDERRGYPSRFDSRDRAGDGPRFGPPRPELDRGMRGERFTGESGAYGPRSDMMGYGGYEPDVYPPRYREPPPPPRRWVSRGDYNMYSRDEDRRGDRDRDDVARGRHWNTRR